jgi:hypothetical protein
MMIKNSEYYPREVIVKDIDPYAFKTSQDVFHALKQMHIGIISYVELDYEVTQWGRSHYARILFDRWNTPTTRYMRKDLEDGKSVDISPLGRRAYMIDYQRRQVIREQKEKEERRIRKQKEEERRIRKQKEEEERRIRKQREEEQRRNKEAAEMFEMENQYINDAQVVNDLEIDYGDEETKFYKFNRKTGEMDYMGKQYIVYV